MTQSERNAARNSVWQGTLSVMVLRTLLTMGEQHGYGIARRIEQIAGGRLSINYGTLYPALLKLEQEGLISSSWGVSDHNRKAKFYKLTRAGRRQIERDTREWAAVSDIMTRFFAANED
jgi:transcriptional regulator